MVIPQALHDPATDWNYRDGLRLLRGTLKTNANKVWVEVGNDILGYYGWFVAREFWLSVHHPVHGAHVSVVLPGIHSVEIPQRVRDMRNKTILLYYDPKIQIGGGNKPFKNFYLRVFSYELNDILKLCQVPPSKFGFHLTIGNTKGIPKEWWPQTTELR
jgi:hypothetical protein